MADRSRENAPQHVSCAVCSTTYQDDPAARRIRRCPACGSRLIRREDGRLGAVTTAAPPPPPKPPGAQGSTRIVRTDIMLAFGVILILVSAYTGITMVATMLPSITLGRTITSLLGTAAICLVTGIAGIWSIASNVQRRPTGAPRTKACFVCAYPLPHNHAGRCPECGKLQNPQDPRNGICPGCHRTLRGFHGDACPECGEDVRMVVDGPPNEDQQT